MTWRNLHRQPVRTCLTALGVAVGVVAIVAFGAIVQGFWQTTNDAIRFGDGDMMIFQAGVAGDLFSSLDHEAVEAALLADPEVVRASAVLWWIMPAEPPRMPFAFTIGLGPEPLREHAHRLLRGRQIEADDEVILGKIAASALDEDVGGVIQVGRRAFHIVGVFETGIVPFDGAVVMALATLQDLSGKRGQVTSFQVQVRPGADPKDVSDRLERSIPNIVAITSAEQYKKVDQGLEIANSMVSVISFMAIVIGSIIVTNTMWMAVNERTREIGVLRALGWSARGIVGMIVIEAAGVSLLACGLGCLLGVGMADLATRLPISQQFIDPVYSGRPFGTAIVVALLLGVLGGALPAWRAARISPAEALRHE